MPSRVSWCGPPLGLHLHLNEQHESVSAITLVKLFPSGSLHGIQTSWEQPIISSTVLYCSM